MSVARIPYNGVNRWLEKMIEDTREKIDVAPGAEQKPARGHGKTLATPRWL